MTRNRSLRQLWDTGHIAHLKRTHRLLGSAVDSALVLTLRALQVAKIPQRPRQMVAQLMPLGLKLQTAQEGLLGLFGASLDQVSLPLIDERRAEAQLHVLRASLARVPLFQGLDGLGIQPAFSKTVTSLLTAWSGCS